MLKMTVYCDGCGADITLTAHQHINLGQSRERDLCMPCYNRILHKLTEVDRDIHFGEENNEYSSDQEKLPTTLFCEVCGITETSPYFGQQYCRYCGAKFKNKPWVYMEKKETK